MALDSVSGARLKAWLADKGWAPYAFQREAWDAYVLGGSGLIHAPAGGGKTYAAYLAALEELIEDVRLSSLLSPPTLRQRRPHERVPVSKPRVLYVVNSAPEMSAAEAMLLEPVRELGASVSITHDVSAGSRQVLVTTPEALAQMLGQASIIDDCSDLQLVIVDKWDELMGTKRGTRMELSLARLRGFSPELRTWALSSTIDNAEEAACSAVGLEDPVWIIRSPEKIATEERKPLLKEMDVLAQHLLACAAGGGFDEDEIFDEIVATVAYSTLTHEEFLDALEAAGL